MSETNITVQPPPLPPPPAEDPPAPQPANRQRGRFVVFEGIDRAGKTTVASFIASNLRANSCSVVEWRFPEYQASHSGKLLRQYLDSGVRLDARTQHLLFAANRAEWVSNINEILARGTTIICDRYVYSGVAYSVAKGLPIEWCFGVESGLPLPDVVFHMRVDPRIAAGRPSFGKELHDSTDFLARVDKAYEQVRTTPGRHIVIDCNRELEDVACDVIRHYAALDQPTQPLATISSFDANRPPTK